MPAHLDARRAGARRRAAGAGAGHARARRSRVGRAGAGRAVSGRRASARCRGRSATRSGRWPGSRSPTATIVAAGDTTLAAVHTPGHAPDHLCFWHDGDAHAVRAATSRAAGTTVWIPAQPARRSVDYLASLERVLALAPARLLPAHGAGHRRSRHGCSQRYIDHRREREEQVLDALRRGDCRRPTRSSTRIYRGLDGAAGAAGAAKACWRICVKLEREGRARRDGDAWHIIDP